MLARGRAASLVRPRRGLTASLRAALGMAAGVALCWAAAVTGARAQGQAFDVPTRAGVTTSMYWAAAPGARATMLLFPGGDGGFGRVEGGRPGSRNFLVRSVPLFLARGLNVAVFGRPSDKPDLDYADRVAEPHLTDIERVLDDLRARSAAPVWLVGTSRGTVSATAAAIRLQGRVAGLVLSSSVVSPRRTGAVPTQALAALRAPVLVVHHAQDACPICAPGDVPAILRGLSNVADKRQVMVQGGGPPEGDPCGALHWHGFFGQEAQVVGTMADWIDAHPPR